MLQFRYPLKIEGVRSQQTRSQDTLQQKFGNHLCIEPYPEIDFGMCLQCNLVISFTEKSYHSEFDGQTRAMNTIKKSAQ